MIILNILEYIYQLCMHLVFPAEATAFLWMFLGNEVADSMRYDMNLSHVL